jgi:hypothetical protein
MSNRELLILSLKGVLLRFPMILSYNEAFGKLTLHTVGNLLQDGVWDLVFITRDAYISEQGCAACANLVPAEALSNGDDADFGGLNVVAAGKCSPCLSLR